MPHLLPFLALIAAVAAVVLPLAGMPAWAGPPAVLAFALLAMHVRGDEKWRGYAFTLWLFAFVAAAMFYPSAFRSVGGFELRRLIVPLIQVIMFGMGTSLSTADFARVFRMPKPVFVGLGLKYTIMPLTGVALVKLFGFESEVAAGVILIGTVSAGVASSVMVYLAQGSIALAVTMTICSTLLAPVLTPLLMKLLAGQYVPIGLFAMMVEIINMIVLPIVAGLVFNRLLHGKMAVVDRLLPVVSMVSICLTIAIITALSRDKLLQVGPQLIVAMMLQNVTGYVLGYAGARRFGLDETEARTVAFVVGLQNGGMASGLAINVLRSSDAGLAPAVFGAWMNISGSALASYWRRKPVRGKADEAKAADSCPAPQPTEIRSTVSPPPLRSPSAEQTPRTRR